MYKEYVFSRRLVILMVANTMLDYNAICEFSDVEPFKLGQLGVGNLIAVVIAFGVALALSVAAQRAATYKVKGDGRKAAALLIGCAAACAIVAGFRLSFDAASAGRSISGGAMASLSPADVFFSGLLLLMLVGEVLASYLDRLAAYEKQAIALAGAAVRIKADLGAIEEQSAAAVRVVNARILEAKEALSAANETVYEKALERAGELQDSFIGYVSKAEKSRESRAERLSNSFEALLLAIPKEADGQAAHDRRTTSATVLVNDPAGPRADSAAA